MDGDASALASTPAGEEPGVGVPPLDLALVRRGFPKCPGILIGTVASVGVLVAAARSSLWAAEPRTRSKNAGKTPMWLGRAVCRHRLKIVVEPIRVLNFPVAGLLGDAREVAVIPVVNQGEPIPPEGKSFNCGSRTLRRRRRQALHHARSHHPGRR